jgi:hypothetical protein
MRMYEAPEKPLLVVSDAQAQGMVALVPSTFEEKLSAWMMKSVWASTVTPASLPASVRSRRCQLRRHCERHVGRCRA